MKCNLNKLSISLSFYPSNSSPPLSMVNVWTFTKKNLENQSFGFPILTKLEVEFERVVVWGCGEDEGRKSIVLS